MIDFAKITVKAGDGGRGSGSRVPISHKQYAKADGGDGGAGGNVLFEATNDSRGLEPYRFEHFFKAKDGQMGFSNLRRGATAEDLILKVPLGTVIKGKTETQEIEGSKSTEVSTNYFEYDLVSAGQKVLVARGGSGGKGNAHLRDEFGRRPKSGEVGEVGETWEVTLELKLIADVGLIGLPNAGKSTLISKLTSAKPKIANYPFTTLEPNLGVFKKGTTSSQDTTSSNSTRDTRDTLQSRDTLILADIPGLIEGASEGKGLGYLFLRHIERVKILVHMIDISQGEGTRWSMGTTSSQGTTSTTGNDQKYSDEKARDTRDTLKIWNDYQVIRKELKTYSSELAKKKEIIVFNKIDLVDEDFKNKALKLFSAHRKKVIAISLEKSIGIEELTSEMFKKLK